jgi:RNA polymerase primary sigma factor
MADDTDTTIGDVLCTTTDAEVCENESLNNDMMRVLNAVLKPEEIAVICESFGIGTPELKRWEVGEKRKKSPERIRQIEQHALIKLRNNRQGRMLLSKYLT